MKLNTYLRWSVISGLFLVPFIPLITSSNLFFPFITGKNFTFRILVALVTGLWLILAMRDSAYRPKTSWILKAFSAFLIILFIADSLSPNPEKSFWSNYERMEGFVTTFHLFLLFVVSSSILDSAKLWTRFLQTSLAVSVLEGIYGVLQLTHKVAINQGGVRLDSTFGNATYFSVYMMFHVFFALLFLFRARMKKTQQWIYGAIAFFDLFIIYFTATRGVFLGLVVGALVICGIVAFFEVERKTLRKTAYISLGTVLALVLLFFAFKNTDFIKNNQVLGRFSSISVNEALPRFYVWNMARKGFLESPKTFIIGWGQESFNYAFNKYYDPRMYTQEQWFDRTHDVFLDWLIAGGILGLLAYLSLFWFLLYYIWHGYHFKRVENAHLRKWLSKLRLITSVDHSLSLADRAILTGLLAAYFFQNIFVFDNLTSYLMFIFVLAFIHQMKGKELSSKWQKRLTLERSLQNSIVLPAILVLTFGGIYFVNADGLRACYTLIDALRPQTAGPSGNLASFQKALAYQSFGDSEIREQLIQSAINAFSSSADQNVKQQFFNLAQSEIQKQVSITPKDARYQLFAGTFFARFSLFDDAQKYLDNALALSPGKQTIYYEIGSNYINRGQADKAISYFQKAYELETKNVTALNYYAISLIYGKQYDMADVVLKKGYGTSLVPNDQIIKAYSDMKQYDRVLTILRQRVADDPNNPQYHVALAAGLLRVGDRSGAIREIQQAMQINPSFKDQGTYYINEIKAGRNP